MPTTTVGTLCVALMIAVSPNLARAAPLNPTADSALQVAGSGSASKRSATPGGTRVEPAPGVSQNWQSRADQNRQKPAADTSPGKSGPEWTDTTIAVGAVVSGVFTVVLAISTILLWRATERLYQATKEEVGDFKKSIRVSERSAKAMQLTAKQLERMIDDLERPYLIVGFGKNGSPTEATKSDRDFEIFFTNYGRTPATITWLCRVISTTDTFPSPIDPQGGRGHAIPYGAVVGANEKSDRFPMSELEGGLAAGPAGGKKQQFFHGFVKYKDLFGTEYVTGFCFKWNRPSGEFRLAGSGEKADLYNYVRKLTRKRP